MTDRKGHALPAADALGRKLLGAVREMKNGMAARTTRIEAIDVLDARLCTGLSQSEFASLLSISTRTLQEWEQGRRSPSGAARTLIRIARRHPAVVLDVLEQEPAVPLRR